MWSERREGNGVRFMNLDAQAIRTNRMTLADSTHGICSSEFCVGSTPVALCMTVA